MAGLQNAGAFTRQVRLVILGQFDGLASLADDTARISRITNINVRGSDKYHVGSATSLVGVVLPGYIVRILATNALKLLAPIRCQEHLVDADEHIDHALFVVLTAEISIVLKLLDKVVSTKFGNFGTTMSIKNCKERETGDKVDSSNVRVLVALAPALHA